MAKPNARFFEIEVLITASAPSLAHPIAIDAPTSAVAVSTSATAVAVTDAPLSVVAQVETEAS